MPKPEASRHYLFASDFDQTLSFNDSGIALSEILGTSGFEQKVAGLARINLVQRVRGTRLHYDSASGEIQSIGHVSAGYGKLAALTPSGRQGR